MATCEALVSIIAGKRITKFIPVAVSWDDIIDLQLLCDFFDAKMKGVCLELLAGHVGNDGGWKTHQTGSFVLGRVTPTVSLLAALRAIFFGSYSTVSS